MLDLLRLSRSGREAIQGALAIEALADIQVGLTAPVRVLAEARELRGGEVVVTGEALGEREVPCRRCLDPVSLGFRVALELHFVEDPGDARIGETGEEYFLPGEGRELDLTDAVREEIALALPRDLLCSQECTGLCPRCGKKRSADGCESCASDEVDARWTALRTLNRE